MTRYPRLLLPLALLLAGCEIDNAAYMIEGKDHALTISREKPYFWSDQYEMDVIVSRMPSCQRRYDMKPARLTTAFVTVFEGGEPNRYLLRQGSSRWYAVNTNDCVFAVIQKPQVEPPVIGVFRDQGEQFTFVRSKQAEASGAR
ncbi:hypothetical protein [Methyloversatilis thermotolerans]|uniref:hypothetical protein n=1 Tax=Methyloversatilis thermotolerans TaxID=1346290 RepID=UPI0003727150|nr:hypothetical protein [Methyloversatilis thermotolerans]